VGHVVPLPAAGSGTPKPPDLKEAVLMQVAVQSLREGNLQEALAQLRDQVRKDPSNAKHRVFLFQLFAVLGQWERALTQLNTAAELDAATLAMAQMYREALKCEVLRAEIFAGKRSPLIFGDPPEWIGLLVEALRGTAEGKHGAARELRDRALDEAPATAGSIDGRPFQWIADADPRLGPIVEAIVAGRYFWVPVQNIRQIVIEAPTDLRDLVWMPVHFTWANQGEAVGLIPTRYPGSENSEDNLVRLARKTEWVEASAGVQLGLGQRLLATDEGDFPLMDTRKIDLDPGAGTPTSPSSAENPESETG
jgi:type VI secretion system protein ImpE